MPKYVENKLKAEARRKYPGNKVRQNRYVYGTLHNRLGWTRVSKKKKGSHGGARRGRRRRRR